MTNLVRDVSDSPRTNAPVSAALEHSPPWLVSTVVHLTVLLALALWSVGMPPDAGFELVFSALSETSPELDLAEAATAELVTEVPVAANVDDLPFELPSQELLSLNAGELPAADSADASAGLLQGLGDELAGQGIPGYTSVFGLSGEGRRFVYVFDRSDSMNSVYTVYNQDAIVRQVSPLALAKSELLHSLGKLAPHHEFQIVFYNHAPLLYREHYGERKLFMATDETKRLASEFVDAIPGEGSTDHWSALQAALALRPDVVFLITDGEAKDDPPLYQVKSLASFCRRKQIQVNVIHFSNVERPRCTLIPLAEETRGQHLFIDLRTFVQTVQ